VTLRVLVADDEPPARRKLLAHLREEADVEVVGEAKDGLEAVTKVAALAPGLVFLDVQMPGLTGLEVVETVGPAAMPPVVFVTAYDEYAVRAFELEALDYLLKPYDAERFRRTMERVRRRLAEPAAAAPSLERLLAALRPRERFLDRFVVREDERVLLVPARSVLRLEAEGNYVRIHTLEGSHLLRETLSRLEERLDPRRFARVHRSEIVAVEAVREVRPWSHGDSIAVLRNGMQVRVSRRYQDRLLGEAPG
jgi:two-component system LytT family response regulator